MTVNELRLSLSPDGKSLASSVLRSDGELWMISGFEPPRNWYQRVLHPGAAGL